MVLVCGNLGTSVLDEANVFLQELLGGCVGSRSYRSLQTLANSSLVLVVGTSVVYHTADGVFYLIINGLFNGLQHFAKDLNGCGSALCKVFHFTVVVGLLLHRNLRQHVLYNGLRLSLSFVLRNSGQGNGHQQQC